MTDFSMMRGDTKVLDVVLLNSDGTPLNLTDMTLTFTASMGNWYSASPDIVKTEGDGIEVTSATDGECSVTIDPADTSDVEWWWGPFSYSWDFQVENLTGEVRTPLRGRLKVYPDVTRNLTA